MAWKISQKMGVFCFPNHQGAFMDPLLIGCNIDRSVTSLTRSDIFVVQCNGLWMY